MIFVENSLLLLGVILIFLCFYEKVGEVENKIRYFLASAKLKKLQIVTWNIDFFKTPPNRSISKITFPTDFWIYRWQTLICKMPLLGGVLTKNTFLTDVRIYSWQTHPKLTKTIHFDIEILFFSKHHLTQASQKSLFCPTFEFTVDKRTQGWQKRSTFCSVLFKFGASVRVAMGSLPVESPSVTQFR